MILLHRRGPLIFTALRQCFHRLFYADRSNVAMQRRGYLCSRALRHSAANCLKFLWFLLRYPPSWRSRRAGSAGHLTAKLFFWLCAVAHTNPSTAANLIPEGV